MVPKQIKRRGYRMVISLEKVPKDKELIINELANSLYEQFDEGSNNISYNDAYEMAYQELLNQQGIY